MHVHASFNPEILQAGAVKGLITMLTIPVQNGENNSIWKVQILLTEQL